MMRLFYKIGLYLVPVLMALTSFLAKAECEVAGCCLKRDGTECGVGADDRFPMYSVMKFPQALFVADFLVRNNIDLASEVSVRKNGLMQDTWSPMLSTFEEERTFTYAELLALSLGQSDNNACDILFRQCGGPWRVESYICSLGIKDIHIRRTERQLHARPAQSRKNWCTPRSMVRLLEWFLVHHDDNEPLRYIWHLMAACQTGEDRLPAAVQGAAEVVHKTGTGYPLPSGLPSGICDVGIILYDDGRQLPIAVFVTAPSSMSRVAEVARGLLNM